MLGVSTAVKMGWGFLRQIPKAGKSIFSLGTREAAEGAAKEATKEATKEVVKGAGKSLSTGAKIKIGAAVGFGSYAGFQKVVNNQSLPETAREVSSPVIKAVSAVGKEVIDSGGGLIGHGIDKAYQGTKEVAGQMYDDAKSKVGEEASGLADKVSNLFGGGGEGGGDGEGEGLFGGLGKMISGIFGGGKMNVLGLVAAAFMLFGNTGWMGKLAGLAIGMLSMGMFGGSRQESAPSRQLATVPQAGRELPNSRVNNVENYHEQNESYIIHRGR